VQCFDDRYKAFPLHIFLLKNIIIAQFWFLLNKNTVYHIVLYGFSWEMPQDSTSLFL